MKNKALALKAIKEDCEITGYYVEGHKTCALGCLALLAGVDRHFLEDDERNSEAITLDILAPVAEAIMEKFGLTRYQQDAIQRANDRTEDVKKRREAVLALLRTY